MYKFYDNAIDAFITSIVSKNPNAKKIFNKKISTAINNNKDTLFFDCVDLAYNDAKRTFVGVGILSDSQKKQCKENLAGIIKKFFNSNLNSNYDNWHEKTCKKFQNDFNKSGYANVTVGMAQKVINLTFKYLYCCKDAKQYKQYFNNCHMTLDDYILEWYTRNVAPNNIVKKWSKIDDYKTYIEIQNEIRNYIKSNKITKTLLEFEFIIFPDEFIIKPLLELRKAIDNYSGVCFNNEIIELFNLPIDPSNQLTRIDDFVSAFFTQPKLKNIKVAINILKNIGINNINCKKIVLVKENNEIKLFTPQRQYNNNKAYLFLTGIDQNTTFCEFEKVDLPQTSGVYIWTVNDKIIYIGRAKNLYKRFNQGYGHISPRNCFKGGQNTNVKMNRVALSENQKDNTITIYYVKTNDYKNVEKILLKKIKTPYNIQNN